MHVFEPEGPFCHEGKEMTNAELAKLQKPTIDSPKFAKRGQARDSPPNQPHQHLSQQTFCGIS